MAELNAESIRNAADLVNQTLLAKGYATERLLFSSINWRQLIADQPHKEALVLEPHEIIYNNDKNVINIIYSLCQALDKSNAQNASFNKTLAHTQAALQESERKLAASDTRAAKLDDKLQQTAAVETHGLRAEIRALSRAQKAQQLELHKLRSANADMQTKYDVEMRKKAAEISALKDKLLDSRNLSNTLSYGAPSLRAYSQEHLEEANSNVVHGAAAGESTGQPKGMAAFVTGEYEQIAAQLSDLIENLMAENSRYSRFVKQASGYFSQVNGKLSAAGLRNPEPVPSPSDYIDVNAPADVAQEIEPFHEVTRPLLSNIYSHFHNLQNLVEVVGGDKDESRRTLQSLVQENKVLQANWDDAMKALDEWKSYTRGVKRRAS